MQKRCFPKYRFFSLKKSAPAKKIDTACFWRFSEFQPTRKWLNNVNLSRFSTQNLFQIRACVISVRKAKHLDTTTMFTYSHANMPLGQSEHVYYLSYFITRNAKEYGSMTVQLMSQNLPIVSCSFDCERKTLERASISKAVLEIKANAVIYIHTYIFTSKNLKWSWLGAQAIQAGHVRDLN